MADACIPPITFLASRAASPGQLPEQECLGIELLLRLATAGRKLSQHRRRRASSGERSTSGADRHPGSALARKRPPLHAASQRASVHASGRRPARSPAGKPSGQQNTSHKPPFKGRTLPVSLPPSARSVCLPSYSLLDTFLRRHPPCEGWIATSCGSSRPSRFPGASVNQGLAMIASDPAEDALLRPRFGWSVKTDRHGSPFNLFSVEEA